MPLLYTTTLSPLRFEFTKMGTVSTPLLLSETEREKLITDHLKQAHFLAAKQAQKVPPHLSDELQGVARIALATAACSFDKSTNVKFKTYAERRIKGALLDFLREQDYLPRQDRTTLKKLTQELNGSLTATSLNAAIDALTSRQTKTDKARKTLLKQAARRILDFGKDNIFTSLSDMGRPPPTN